MAGKQSWELQCFAEVASLMMDNLVVNMMDFSIWGSRKSGGCQVLVLLQLACKIVSFTFCKERLKLKLCNVRKTIRIWGRSWFLLNNSYIYIVLSLIHCSSMCSLRVCVSVCVDLFLISKVHSLDRNTRHSKLVGFQWRSKKSCG